mgnify:CR=1 FL=1
MKGKLVIIGLAILCLLAGTLLANAVGWAWMKLTVGGW